MRKNIAGVARQPLVQFLVLGVLFYGAFVWIGGAADDGPDQVIRVTAVDISRLDAGWRARWNRPPTEMEFAGLVRAHIREVALYRHAVAMGLDQDDPVIRRMLGTKLQTLTQNVLEFSLAPTESELRTWFEENAERYRAPALITFTQIFLDPDRRGDATLDDAERILTTLRAQQDPTAGTEDLGDSFLLQRYYPGKPLFEVSRLFGQRFAESVFALSPGEWHDPVLSGYGVHLVYVHHKEDAPAPEFEAVQEEVKRDWIFEKQREIQDDYVNSVMASYEVVFDDGAWDGDWTLMPESSE
jgi:peptidyl-prolyl cis-trans isomerase C